MNGEETRREAIKSGSSTLQYQTQQTDHWDSRVGRQDVATKLSTSSPRVGLSPNPVAVPSSSDTPSTVTTALNVSIHSSPRLSQQSSDESIGSSTTTASSSNTAQQNTNTDILSRIERSGRALRKSAAIDSEDHVLTTNTLFHHQPPPQQLPPFSLANLQQATDPLAAVVAQLAQQNVNGAPGAPPTGLMLNPGNMQAFTNALLNSQQHQLNAVKQEQLQNDDILKQLVSNPEMLNSSWLMNNMNPLVNLTLMQHQQNEGLASMSVGGGETLDNKLVFDMGRNQLSTESTTSSSSGQLPPFPGVLPPTTGGSSSSINAEQIPRKQDIQNDIRHNKGRFELVRKRGRSEVWNLFGQVIDKQTGLRLPYVACYACKVLYTDTGGGTGNMTRHRCSMGTSYRSSYGSSLDTLGEGCTQSSSFDTSQAINGPNSPETSQISFSRNSQQHNTSAAREAFANSSGYHATATGSLGSSGYGSAYASASLESLSDTHRNFFRSSSAGNNTSIGSVASILLHPNSAAIQPPPVLHRNGSSGLSNTPIISLNLSAPQPPSNTSRSQATSPNPLQQPQQPQPTPQLTTLQLGQTFKPTPTRPSSSLHSHPLYRHPHSPHISPAVVVTGAGYVFTQQDKQLFTQAVVQFCSRDLHNFDVVSGEGFKNLIETVLFIGRRSHGDTQVSNTFDPVRNLIPDAQQLREVFMSKDDAVREATMHDLDGLKDVGISLSCQRVYFGGDLYLCVNANYLTEDWQITKRTLKVSKCESETPTANQYVQVVKEALEEHQIANAKIILLAFDSEFDDDQKLDELPGNVVVIKNIVRALNKILIECFANCPDKEKTTRVLDLCKRIVRHLLENELLLKKMPPVLANVKLVGEDAQPFPDDYVLSVYLMLKFVKENLSQIQETLESINANDLLEQIRQADWSKASEIEQFLTTFYETVNEFGNTKEPIFQKILIECLTILDELRKVNEHSEGETSDQQPASMKLERTKSIDGNRQMDEPSSWTQQMSQMAEHLLSKWKDNNLSTEHYMSTVLEPKFKQLQLICNDMEKAKVYSQLREAIGLNKMRKESQSKQDGEPSRKRRNFLVKLEDYAMEEDELEAYLRTPLAQLNTKSVLEFWSSLGEINFQKIAHFTRFILGTQCALNPIRLHVPSTKIDADDISTLLRLRPEVYSTLNRHSHFLKNT